VVLSEEPPPVYVVAAGPPGFATWGVRSTFPSVGRRPIHQRHYMRLSHIGQDVIALTGHAITAYHSRMATAMTPVSLRLRELRIAKGLTQAQLADASHVPQSTISRLEAGKLANVNLKQLQQLADALGVHAALLIAHPEAEKKGKRG
jgi:DNA-binding Xre family transcriptional regulator